MSNVIGATAGGALPGHHGQPAITGTPSRIVPDGHLRHLVAAHPSFAYQWLRTGAPIAGATSSFYTLTPADAGK